MKELVLRVHAIKVRIMERLQSPLLLLIRLVFGSQFYMTGHGKLTNLERTTAFFTELALPAPKLNAILAGVTEMVGGLCLVLGLGGRVVTFPLIFTMCVAYATAHNDVFVPLRESHDLGPFIGATPFPFLLACLIILVFGSGSISADYFILKKVKPEPEKK